jgi:hypothetical protein
MSCRRHSQNTTQTTTGHNQTAQRAADSDQFRTAVAQATTSTNVTVIPHHHPPSTPKTLAHITY